MHGSTRVTGVYSAYAVILLPDDARRLARDRLAISARTAGEARQCRPGAEVLALIVSMPDGAEIDLGRLPVVSSGTVPAHPFYLMVSDPMLSALGQVEDSAFVGLARLIPAGDLPALEVRFGWRRDQRLIDEALGLGRAEISGTPGRPSAY